MFVVQSSDTMHDCLKGTLTLFQLFGTFPIHNIRSSNPLEIEFQWLSWKMFITIFLAASYLFCATTAFMRAFSHGAFVNQLISPLFYLNLFVINMLFVQIARNWRKFILEVSKVEGVLLRKYPCKFNLKRTVNVSAIVFFVIAIVEHSLSVLNYIFSSACQNYSTGMEYYFRKQFHYIFHYINYHIVYAIFFFMISWLGTLAWNVGDTLIIVVSLILSTRFKQISDFLKIHLEQPPLKNESEKNYIKLYYPQESEIRFWREIREDYEKIDKLCRLLDRNFSTLITFSYVYNLTFILVQLFNSLRQMDEFIERLYFFFSFGFVIVRTIAVSVYGASINEESKAFIPILNSVPTHVYNVEIQRLILEIHINSTALTGHNFFKLTRGLVLNVAAAIITYELVLIQFNQATLEKFMAENGTICY